MKNKFIKLTVLLLIAVVPVFSSRAQDIPSLDIDALIEQYLQGLKGQLPTGQKDQIDAYRKYIKDSVQSVIPQDVLEEQLKAAQELFPTVPGTAPGTPPVTQSTTDQELSLSADPQSPLPKTRITVSANFNVGGGFQFPDVQKGATADYQWYLDNTYMPAFSGVGQNTLSFASGILGTIHTVRLQARLAGGKVIRAALLVPVVDADIVWYTDSYTPPEYRGKALPTLQSPIVASIQTFVPASFGILNYVWTIDDDTPLDAYGIGKNQVLIGFPLQSHEVSVLITDLGGNIEITKNISIERARPEVVLHQVRGGKYDYYEAARKTFETTPASAFSIVAVPYYFNVQTLQGLRFTWAFNKNTLPEAARNPDVFTLNIGRTQLASGTRVERSLQLTVENKNPKKPESGIFTVPVTIR